MGAVKGFLFDMCEQVEDDFDAQDALFMRVLDGEISIEELELMAAYSEAVQTADEEDKKCCCMLPNH